jgi:tetratricopeptide (TPR) repeat protein
MEYEGTDNQPNTNTAAAAKEMLDNLTAPPPAKKPSKLSGILDKVGKSPLFIGKRKYISIPLFAIALIAIIAVPIIILTQHPAPVTIEAWLEDQQTSGAIYEANRAANAGDIDEALRILDEALSQEQNIDRAALLRIEKSAIAANGDRSELAIEVALEIIEFNRARGDKDNLENNYAYLGGLYDMLGDEDKALEAYLAAKAVADETGRRINYIFYLERIAEITGEEVE